MLSPQSIYQQNRGVFQKPSPDKMILVSLNDDQFYFEIDGLALKIWTNIDGKKTIQEILSEVCEQEKVPSKYQNRLEEDTESLIQKLLQHKLISLSRNS